jgi:single-strand DNA-binding protein
MSFNQVILFGRLTADPEVKVFQGEQKLCTINLAVDRPKAKDGTQSTDYIKCNAWGKTAEMVSTYFTKGKPILVVGSLQDNDYTDKNGVKHYSKVVQVQSVSFTMNDNSKPQGQNQGYRQNNGYTRSRQAPPPQPPVTVNNLEEFEEILSDGEIPF